MCLIIGIPFVILGLFYLKYLRYKKPEVTHVSYEDGMITLYETK